MIAGPAARQDRRTRRLGPLAGRARRGSPRHREPVRALAARPGQAPLPRPARRRPGRSAGRRSRARRSSGATPTRATAASTRRISQPACAPCCVWPPPTSSTRILRSTRAVCCTSAPTAAPSSCCSACRRTPPPRRDRVLLSLPSTVLRDPGYQPGYIQNYNSASLCKNRPAGPGGTTTARLDRAERRDSLRQRVAGRRRRAHDDRDDRPGRARRRRRQLHASPRRFGHHRNHPRVALRAAGQHDRGTARDRLLRTGDGVDPDRRADLPFQRRAVRPQQDARRPPGQRRHAGPRSERQRRQAVRQPGDREEPLGERGLRGRFRGRQLFGDTVIAPGGSLLGEGTFTSLFGASFSGSWNCHGVIYDGP